MLSEARRSRDCTSARKGPWDGDAVARPVSGCSDVAWGGKLAPVYVIRCFGWLPTFAIRHAFLHLHHGPFDGEVVKLVIME